MLAGAFLLYLRLRPERGWQGVLDGLLLSTAAAAAGWVARARAGRAAGLRAGSAGTLVAVLYPVARPGEPGRHGLDRGPPPAARAPVWLRWVAVAFAVQAAAGLVYVGVGPDEQTIGGGLGRDVHARRGGSGRWPR